MEHARARGYEYVTKAFWDTVVSPPDSWDREKHWQKLDSTEGKLGYCAGTESEKRISETTQH